MSETCKSNTATSSCCGPPATSDSNCCDSSSKSRFDWLLWGSGSIILVGYCLQLLFPHDHNDTLPNWLATMSHGIFELMNTMWWGVLLAAIFVGLLSRVPQAMVTSVLGQGGTFTGIIRATAAGVALDLCSHGILMVGMGLYQRGASIGQVMAFLIASPWNSLSLTIILVALIGLPWTLAFILLSMLIAIISGYLFDRLVAAGVLPPNPNTQTLEHGYKLWPAVCAAVAKADKSFTSLLQMFFDGLKASQMVLRWLFFGVVLATILRSFVSLSDFQQWFGPTAIGLAVTLLAATIIEVCSEGSTPIAADILNRAQAPGNGFAFLMTGVATDYTEVMVLKDTTKSWRIALFLPLVAVPQVVIIAFILNQWGG